MLVADPVAFFVTSREAKPQGCERLKRPLVIQPADQHCRTLTQVVQRCGHVELYSHLSSVGRQQIGNLQSRQRVGEDDVLAGRLVFQKGDYAGSVGHACLLGVVVCRKVCRGRERAPVLAYIGRHTKEDLLP